MPALDGGPGDDRIVGGRGSQRFFPSLGDDEYLGGSSRDYLDWDSSRLPVSVDLSLTTPQATNWGMDSFKGIEFVEGSDFDDFLRGSEGDDFLGGRGGDDQIYGGGGDDFVNGSSGNNVVEGGDGDDEVKGAGLLSGGEGNDLLNGMDGDDTLSGGTGDDELQAQRGSDKLSGGDGNDVLKGGPGNDRLAGDGGDDFLIAGRGGETSGTGDSVSGGSGVDECRHVEESDGTCEMLFPRSAAAQDQPTGSASYLPYLVGSGLLVLIGLIWAGSRRRRVSR
jgi:Ca2+-binding RTX toxin-like protein